MKNLLEKYEKLYRNIAHERDDAALAIPLFEDDEKFAQLDKAADVAMTLYLNKVDQLVGWSNW
jgi:hypothetical protein